MSGAKGRIHCYFGSELCVESSEQWQPAGWRELLSLHLSLTNYLSLSVRNVSVKSTNLAVLFPGSSSPIKTVPPGWSSSCPPVGPGLGWDDLNIWSIRNVPVRYWASSSCLTEWRRKWLIRQSLYKDPYFNCYCQNRVSMRRWSHW